MTPEEENAVRYEIGIFRLKLDELERQHRQALEAMRLQLSEMEGKAAPLPGAPHPAAASVSPPLLEAVADPVEAHSTAPAPAIQPDRSFHDVPGAMTAPPPLPSQAVPAGPAQATAPQQEKTSFEMQLGRVWLVRFGIVIFITGLVLLGNYAYRSWIHNTPNVLKLLFLFFCAGGLIETGRKLAAKTTMKTPGEVILGGGLAFFYYCTFAAHHVQRLKVIDSPVFAAVLLLVSAGLIGAVSWFRNSRTIAILGIVLASYSTMLQPIGWISCFSNVLLAGAGVALKLRPGWAGPGAASMIGTYGAFLGWQLLGASRGDLRDPAVLWFLPPVWAMFSLPGVLGRFKEAMTDRARAWFTGMNNGAFFALFSVVWFSTRHDSNYWMVCAIFGGILLALAVIGRRASQPAGGVNMAQGLALVSIAILAKLEGYNLAFAFGFEALALAIAFCKYRGRPELVFCVLCALEAAFLAISPSPSIPVWSAGITCLLVGAAWAMLKRGSAVLEGKSSNWSAGAGWIVFVAAVLGTVFGWSYRLPVFWVGPSLACITVALTAGAVFARGPWKLSEATHGSLVFLVFLLAALWGDASSLTTLSVSIDALLILTAAVLWHRAEALPEKSGEVINLDKHPAIPAWIFSAATVVISGMATKQADLGNREWMAVACCVQILLVIIAILSRSGRLAPCAAMLSLPLVLQFIIHDPVRDAGLYIAISAFICAMFFYIPPIGGWLAQGHRKAALWILRTGCFIASCQWLHATWPDNAGDAFAISGMALMAYAFMRRKVAVTEAWGFVSLAAVWLIWESVTSWWTPVSEPSWRGYVVVAALWMLAAGAKAGRTAKGTTLILQIFAPLAAVATAIWATQMLVWRYDWRMAAILWSMLGFVFVTTGLCTQLRAFRIAGFVLLSGAILKVFALDVWDFRAFGRVVSFIVLGAALILLGLFYNRFTTVVKKLLEEDEAEG